TNMLPTLLNFLILVMIYILVPNRKVSIIHASVGATTAIILFWAMRKFFGLMILNNATYKTLYGALAALPIFLVWMYLVWAVVIFGAVVTASIDEYQKQKRQITQKQN
ncbi:MAG: YihY family inner membrane protein, partial [Alphaproteobacteria bacterium]|nr:YihY family inner membrane protein [Alphaproteobacteria bacterium]